MTTEESSQQTKLQSALFSEDDYFKIVNDQNGIILYSCHRFLTTGCVLDESRFAHLR